ncbi:MAG: hypothetical protein KF862_07390 [Chitinophagaceae bacterium]|nr:hypothetical protein [Chitinophagaceae bacterium]
MTKKKQHAKEPEEKKPFIILNAKVKEGICEYSYEINSGPCEGDQVKGRKGINIVHDDLTDAFSKLDVHLAILDDAFIDQELSLEEMEKETKSFRVYGFRVSGTDENEGFILSGEKWVKYGSVGIDSPKITKASAYPYWQELCDAMEAARNEVQGYMNGKSAPKMEQTEINFSAPGGDDFNNPM